MTEKIRSLVATRAAAARLTDRIHGNDIQAHVLPGGTARTSRLIGFVHNPDSDPAVLTAVTRSMLARVDSRQRAAGSRWLVVAPHDTSVPIETYRQVWAQLGLRTVFERTLVVVAGGRIATLSA